MFSIDGSIQDKCWDIKPPRAINKFLYRCDRHFHLESILPLYQDIENNYGCLIISGEESKFYKLSLSEENFIGNLTVKLSRDHNKGGQSSNRFARLHDQDIESYINKVYDKCLKYYSFEGQPTIESLSIVGPGNKKKLLANKLKSSCLSNIIKSPLTSDGNVELSLSLARQQICNINKIKEKEIQDEFKEYLRLDSDRLEFGDKNVIKSLKEGMIQKLYIHLSAKEAYSELIGNNLQPDQIIDVCDDWIIDYGYVVGLKWY